jgi:transposase
MKALTISDPETMVLALQDEIRRSNEARYDHRLHAVLLVAQGVNCLEVAAMLGDSIRTIQYWVNRFETEGFSGLADADRPGRPPKLVKKQLDVINTALRASPVDLGFNTNIWDGKTLSLFIEKRFGIVLGVRQCQRLFRQLGFRLRKPRPLIAKADQDRQAELKKTPRNYD